MKKYTVILPINEVTPELKEYLTTALKSVEVVKDSVDLMVVHAASVKESAVKACLPKGLKPTYVANSGKTDFASQVNLGIENVTTEWFSILEADDAYAPKWFQNVDNYIAAYPHVDVFLPIVADVDEKNDFLSFVNESIWALGFTEVQGELDNAALLEYPNFQTSGAVYKTDKVKAVGKLKSNIKLSFGYEFLLRLTHNNTKIMTIPKIGYKHTTLRPNSLFWKYQNDEAMKFSKTEGKFWMDTARKEYYFTEDREVTYSE